MTISQDWQLQYRDLLIGPDSPYDAPVIDGLAAIPELRSNDRARLRRHGELAGDDFLGGRTLTLTLAFKDPADCTEATLDQVFGQNMHALRLAFRPGEAEEPLSLQIPGVAWGAPGPVRVNCRPRRMAATIDRRWGRRVPAFAVELHATDPRIYDDAEQTGLAALPSPSGGLTFPVTPPLVFGTVSTGGTILADNAGTFPTPVQFRIDGPVTNPRVENVTLGRALQLTYTLDASEHLLIDSDTRTVMLGGTASRYSALGEAPEWFDLAPGVNEIKFSALTATAGTLTASWRSAWI